MLADTMAQLPTCMLRCALAFVLAYMLGGKYATNMQANLIVFSGNVSGIIVLLVGVCDTIYGSAAHSAKLRSMLRASVCI